MRPVALLVTLAGAFLGGLSPTSAVAHGPCGCLDPVMARSGHVVTITAWLHEPGATGYPAYRVVFNPRPGDLGIAPGYLSSAYRPDAPTAIVFDRPRSAPVRNARFRVPRGTRPGLYMVLIFDGGEGGAHNTWDYLHVIDPAGSEDNAGLQQTRPFRPPDSDRRGTHDTSGSSPWLLVATVTVAAFVIGAVGGVARGRRA
jgi:hypothetical protein